MATRLCGAWRRGEHDVWYNDSGRCSLPPECAGRLQVVDVVVTVPVPYCTYIKIVRHVLHAESIPLTSATKDENGRLFLNGGLMHVDQAPVPLRNFVQLQCQTTCQDLEMIRALVWNSVWVGRKCQPCACHVQLRRSAGFLIPLRGSLPWQDDILHRTGKAAGAYRYAAWLQNRHRKKCDDQTAS